MEILFFVVSVLVGVFMEGVGVKVNMAGLGVMVEIGLVGAVILWSIRHNLKKLVFGDSAGIAHSDSFFDHYFCTPGEADSK